MAKNKTKLILAIIVIVIIISGYFLYDYYQKQKRINEVNGYKRGFYEGMLCEYGCPLKLQEYNNKTQNLPELGCIKGCTTSFKEKYTEKSFKEEELEMDNLLKDIDDAIKNCKTKSVNMTILSLDNTAYFSCAKKSIEELKGKYNYLK